MHDASAGGAEGGAINPHDVHAEHERLRRQTEILQREHDALHERPHDVPGHGTHLEKLKRHKRASLAITQPG